MFCKLCNIPLLNRGQESNMLVFLPGINLFLLFISVINWIISFSPSGKLVQIEYALAAVAAGAPSVGIKGIKTLILVFSWLRE